MLPNNPLSKLDVEIGDIKDAYFNDVIDLTGQKMFERGATADDIKQQSLASCWALAMIGSICQQDSTYIKTFVFNNSSTVENTNKLRLIDPEFCVKEFFLNPLIPAITKNNHTHLYTTTSYEDDPTSDKAVKREAWVPLIEKCLASYLGSYNALNYGLPEMAGYILSGGLPYVISHKDVSARALFEVIRFMQNKGCFITSGHFTTNGGHAFSLINAYLDSREMKVCLRNPWGVEKNYDSEIDKFADENDDGEFTVPFESYLRLFSSTHFTINFNISPASGYLRQTWDNVIVETDTPMESDKYYYLVFFKQSFVVGGNFTVTLNGKTFDNPKYFSGFFKGQVNIECPKGVFYYQIQLNGDEQMLNKLIAITNIKFK